MRQGYAFPLVSLGLLFLGTAPAGADEFAVRDGDTVVFLGDSITAARAYGKIIENYTLLRYPERKVRFVNAGWGGDTAAGGLKRLERDVFANQATLLTVAYGINDIGWGLRADEAHKRTYLESIRGIVEACKKRGVRVYICSAAVTAADPAMSEDSFLQKMCDEGMELARSLGGNAIDLQRAMRAVQKRVWAANAATPDKAKHSTLHAADGIHLNDLGQLAMAFAILKGLGAPSDVSAIRIDARGPKLLAADGCTVTDLAHQDGVLAFTRLDRGLPLNNGLFFALNFRFIPIPDELNRYLLTVMNLPEDRYEVVADGRSAGTFTAQQLAAGVNLASTTPDPWQPGGPWNAQANVLQSLTDARHHLATADKMAGIYLAGSPTPQELARQADRTNEQIEAMQRTAAKPRPYRFGLRRFVPPAKDGKKGGS
jgi:lysophospholipase L1-like esterase